MLVRLVRSHPVTTNRCTILVAALLDGQLVQLIVLGEAFPQKQAVAVGQQLKRIGLAGKVQLKSIKLILIFSQIVNVRKIFIKFAKYPCVNHPDRNSNSF